MVFFLGLRLLLAALRRAAHLGAPDLRELLDAHSGVQYQTPLHVACRVGNTRATT